MSIKNEILSLIQSGNSEVLLNLITLHEHSEEFQMLLKEKDFFKELYSFYAEHLKDKELKHYILQGIQFLVAYGLTLDSDFIEDYWGKTDKYCSLINTYHHSLGLDYCIKLRGFLCLDSNSLNQYLNYVNTHLRVENSDLIKALKDYHGYLQTLEREEQRGRLTQFFERSTEDKALQPMTDWTGSRATLYPVLSECTCNGHERVERRQLENELIHQATSRYEPSLLPQLKYLSLGSGNLLQDFIIVLKLLKSGYKNITLSMIEPDFNPLHRKHFEFLIRIAKELGAEVSIQHFYSVDDYRRKTHNKKVHLISSIDFANIFKDAVFADVVDAQTLLEDQGFFLFSFDQYKLGITKENLYPLANLNDQRGIDEHFHPHIFREPVLAMPKIVIAILGQQNLFDQWIYLLPKLKSAPFKEVTVFMEQPAEHNYFSMPGDKKNFSFTEKNLSDFLSLSLTKPARVVFIEPTLNQDWCYQVDIVTSLDQTGKDMDRLYQGLDDIKARFPSASCYVGAYYINDAGFKIPIAKGHRTTWLPEQEVFQIDGAIRDLLAKLTEIRDSLPKPLNLNFFAKKSQNSPFMEAIERAVPTFSEAIQNKADLSSSLHAFLMKKINNQPSIYESLGTWCGTSKQQNQLADFVKTRFDLDLTKENKKQLPDVDESGFDFAEMKW